MPKKKKTGRSKLKYMVLSLIIAIAAWTVVTYSTNPDMTRKITGVRIELDGTDTLEERGLILVGEEDLPKMTVKVRGKRSDIMSVMDDMRVVLDLSSIDKAGNYRVEGSAKLTNGRVTVEDIISNGVDVIIDKYETREYAIQMFQDGAVDGRLVKSTPEKREISISGAATELDMIERTYATVYLDDTTKEGEVKTGVGIIPKDDIDAKDLTTVKIHSETITVKNEFFYPVEAAVIPVSENVPLYELDRNASSTNPPTVTVGVKEKNVEGITVKAIVKEYNEQEMDAYIKADEGIYVPDHSKKVRVTPIWMPLSH